MAAAAAAHTAAFPSIQLRCRASWDTNPGPKPLRVPRTVKPPRPSAPRSPAPMAPRTAVLEKEQVLPLFQLLNLDRIRSQRGKTDEQYTGYERWLPIAPEVKKPRSIYNAASLAYIGDIIYEDLLLKKLLNEDYLTDEERDILRWGKNIATNKTRTTKRAGVAVYNRASSLETLIGYLYLTNEKRLEGLMRKLGFSTGSSQLIAEELRMNFSKKAVEPQTHNDL